MQSGRRIVDADKTIVQPAKPFADAHKPRTTRTARDAGINAGWKG